MLTVDKIEGKIVRVEHSCDDGSVSYSEMDISSFSGDIREGDILVSDGEVYSCDRTATEERRREILDLQNSLWEQE